MKLLEYSARRSAALQNFEDSRDMNVVQLKEFRLVFCFVYIIHERGDGGDHVSLMLSVNVLHPLRVWTFFNSDCSHFSPQAIIRLLLQQKRRWFNSFI